MEMAKLKNQGVAEAFIKLWGDQPRAVQITDVPSPAFGQHSDQKLKELRDKAISANGSYFTAIDQLENERTARQIAAFGEPLRFAANEFNPAIAESNPEGLIDEDDPFT